MYAPILPPLSTRTLEKPLVAARGGQVRDDCETMSTGESRNGREADSIPEGGILAALPRARPQRASARRAAARGATAASGDKTSTTTRTTKSPRTTGEKKPAAAKKRVAVKKPSNAKKRVAKLPEPPVPKQGYEPEDELELGKTVRPPSSVELVESVADIVGELANSSLAAGGRLLKDAFSLLRRP
jgi:hypothetical protein